LKFLGTEQYNEQSGIGFPFSDDANRVSVEGVRLPPDFVVDAVVYSIGGTGPLHVSAVDRGKLYISDDSGRRVAYTNIVEGYSPLTATEPPHWNLGGVVFGPDVDAVDINSTITFEPAQTCFVPGAVVGLDQPGVRAVVDAAGRHHTGDIQFTGTGTRIHTRTEGGKQYFRVDAVGKDESDDLLCGLPPPLQCIHVIVEAGAFVGVSGDNGALFIDAPGVDLSDTCPAGAGWSKDAFYDDHRDPCKDVDKPEEPLPTVEAHEVTVCVDNNTLSIFAVSSETRVNPLSVLSQGGVSISWKGLQP